MKPYDQLLKQILYTSFVLCHLITIFWYTDFLNYTAGLIAIGCILISFRGAKRMFQILSFVFLLAGILLIMDTEISLVDIPFYMTSTALLLSLLYVLPFLNSSFKIGRYDQHMNKLLKVRATHLGQIYYRSSLVSYMLSIFLFFAAIPLVYEVIKKHLHHFPQQVRNQMISKTILRGFAMAVIWSPIEVLVALGVFMTGVNYLDVLPWLLLLSAVLIIIDWLAGWRYKKYSLPDQTEAQPMNRTIIVKMVTLLIILSLFILSVGVLHRLLEISFFTGVTLAIIPFSFIWALILKRPAAYLKYSYLNWKQHTPGPGYQQFMLLFLSLGFFNSMLGETAIMEWVQTSFQYFTEYPILLFLIIQLLSIFLSFVGFHPLVSISIFGILVQPLIGLINPVSLAIVLITSSLSTASAGTYNSTVTMVSQMLKINPYQITWWNVGFALLYGSLGTLLAVLLL